MRLPASQEITRNIQNFPKDFEPSFRASCPRFQHTGEFTEGPMAKRARTTITKITIETESLLILQGRASRRAWCPLCAAEAEMIALESLGVVSNLDRLALEEWLNSGDLHCSRSADGSAQICLNSLLARVQKTKSA
jgi:hypothetical protein